MAQWFEVAAFLFGVMVGLMLVFVTQAVVNLYRKSKSKRMVVLKIIIWLVVVVVLLFAAFFIAKTHITDSGIRIERPLTMIFFVLTILAGFFNK